MSVVIEPKSPKSPTERITEKFRSLDPEAFNSGDYVVKQGLRSPSNASDSASDNSQLKTTKDGRIVLIPQPSDSLADPLNWSLGKKCAVFACILPGCFLTDWVITWGSTLFEAQAMEWNMLVPKVANSISGAIFMQGPGGLLAVPLASRFGWLPVLFWSQFLTLITTIGATYAKSYAGFTACRTLQGFFGAPPQVLGLQVIYSLFFFHQRARAINLWAFSFLIGPYLGPLLSGLIVSKLDWRNTFGVLCGFYGFSVLMIIFLGEETTYDREGVPEPRKRGIMARIKAITGIQGIKETSNRPSVLEVSKDLFGLLSRPYLLIPTIGFVTFITMWTIGIVSVITQLVKPPPYLFSNTAVSLLFFAPMGGTIVAEIWGHWFNDFICNRYIKSHGGKFKPEVRLWGVYPAWIVGIGGLILFGQALQHNLHWVAIAFGWGMNCFSTLGTTAAVSAYLLDVLPHHASLAAAWINAFRTIGGFTVVYFQVPWIHHNGPAIVFGCQAAITVFFILSIILTQIKGASWRKSFPAPLTSRTM